MLMGWTLLGSDAEGVPPPNTRANPQEIRPEGSYSARCLFEKNKWRQTPPICWGTGVLAVSTGAGGVAEVQAGACELIALGCFVVCCHVLFVSQI